MRRLSFTGVSFLLVFTLAITCERKGSLMKYLTVHYHRYDNSYDGWTLWVWTDERSVEIKPTGKDNYGLLFRINLEDFGNPDKIGLIPKFKEWESKDDPDRFWNRSFENEIWILQGEKRVFTQTPDISHKVLRAFLDSTRKLTVILSHPISKDRLNPGDFKIYLKGKSMAPIEVSFYNVEDAISNILSITTGEDIDIDLLPGKVTYLDYKPGEIHVRDILLDEKYITHDPLGTLINEDEVLFRLYAPSASKVVLNLYPSARSKDVQRYNMVKRGKGIWEIKLDKGSCIGQYYTYNVDTPDPHSNPEKELTDPYAVCTTAPFFRAKIIEDSTPICDGPYFDLSETIIYEVHIRDFSISGDSGIKQKGKYLGFSEKGTTIPGTDILTGIDHLVELGINAVHLLPVHDFENDEYSDNYNWGYMPINFNSPDGWYATNPEDESRIIELKKLINTLHENGIKVILDMVYNHTAEVNPEVQYNFNGIVPHFYYREKPDGSYWNGSGCGNEVRTENPMVRKFIIDSMIHWVKDYKVDGFRLDLMGLIDIETIRLALKELRKIKPDIVIYGEPWVVGKTPIKPTLKGDQRGEGFAVFTDNFRDALKGPWNNVEPGYIQKGLFKDKVKKGIMGSVTDFTDSPLETINYVACHDGRTLWDRIVATTRDEEHISDDERIAMDKLAAGIILTSQGIPFLHAGQEFLRTKFGEHNSYNLPDSINMIRWTNKKKYHEVFEYYKGLINLRKEHPVFRMKTKEEILSNLNFFEDMGIDVPGNCIGYKLNGGGIGDSWKEIIVLINPHRNSMEFRIPKGKWNVVVNKQKAGTEIIKVVSGEKVNVSSISINVLYR